MKAIILAGGKGERLRPFTDNYPKGMVKINGKPILEYEIDWLKSYGITEIVFACGYKHERIMDYFVGGNKHGIKIQYSIEAEPLGRGGAFKKAWGLIKEDETILAMNGDIYTDLNLNDLIKAHNEKKGVIATICLFPFKSSYGVVWSDESGLVESFEEKRTLPYWVNGGIYLFKSEVKNYLPDSGDHEVTMFPELAKKKLLQGYKSLDYWRGIDTIKDLNEFISDAKYLSVVRKAVGNLNPN